VLPRDGASSSLGRRRSAPSAANRLQLRPVYVLRAVTAQGRGPQTAFQDWHAPQARARRTLGAAIAFYVVDITLLAAVVTRSRGVAFAPSLRPTSS
jgi:hypothetical protein